MSFSRGAAVGLLCGFGIAVLAPDILYAMRLFAINVCTASISEEEKLKKGPGVEDASFHSMVLPSDIDRNMHYNNARFLRELCFSRRHYFKKLGFWKVLDAHDSNAFIVAQTVRYRREMSVFQTFTISTKILAISDRDNSLFLESRFIDVSGFVAAVHVCKYKIVPRKKTVAALTARALLSKGGLGPSSVPGDWESVPFLKHWEAANTVSSLELNPRPGK